MTDNIDRTDELLELIAEDNRRETALGNGWHPDDPGPDEPPDVNEGDSGTDDTQEAGTEDHAPSTWEPVDLGPWLRGEITPAATLPRTAPFRRAAISSIRGANTLSSAKPNPAKRGSRWAVWPPNSPPATTSSTSITRKRPGQHDRTPPVARCRPGPDYRAVTVRRPGEARPYRMDHRTAGPGARRWSSTTASTRRCRCTAPTSWPPTAPPPSAADW